MKKLSGKYLKARQLAKEMEEKAKETAEKKEMAQEKKEKAERLLGEAQSIEAELDLEDVEERLKEGNENISEKDFEEGVEKFGEVIDQIQAEALSKHSEILEKINDFFESETEEEEFSSLKEDIEESEELIEEGKLEEGFEKTLEIKNESKEMIEEDLNERLEELENLVEMVEESEDVKTEGQEIISKARYSLDAEEYKRTHSLIQEAREGIENAVEDELQDMGNKLDSRMDRLKEKGIEVPKAVECLNEGREKKENDEYNTALDRFQECRERINQYYDQEVLQERFANLRDEIEEAKEIDAPTGTVEEMVEEAEKLIEKDNIEEADDLLKEAFEKIEEAKFDKVLNTIAESREDFIRAKDIGADIEEPMELLNTARDSLKNNDYKEALEWARKGREEVQDLIKKFDKAKKEIQNKRDELARLKDVLDTDYPDLENLMDEAEVRLEEKNYEETMVKIEELDEEMENKVQEEVEELLDEFANLIDLADDLESKIKDISKQLDESRKKADSGNYLEAANMAKSGKNIAKKKIEEELEEKIEKVRENKERTEIEDEEIEREIDELIDESEEELDMENFEGAIESMKEAKMELKEAKTGAAEKHIEDLSERLNNIEELDIKGIDIKPYKEKVAEAKGKLENEKNEEAITKVNEISREFSEEIRDHAEKFYEEAKKTLQEAEETGVKIETLEDELKDAQEHLENNNFMEAIRSSLDVEEKAEEKRKERSEAYEKISDSASKLSELKKEKKKEDIKPIKDKLVAAKKDFKKRNYEDSMEKAEEAELLLSEFEARTLFSDTKREIKEKLKKMKKTGMLKEKIKEFNVEVESLAELTEEGNYSEAQEKIEGKNEELNTLLREKANEKIEDIREFLDSAQNIGFSVQDYKDKLKRTESFLNQENFLKALDNIKNIENELDELKNKSDNAREKIEDAKFTLRKAEVMGADIEEEKELMEKAKDYFKKDRYEKSIEKAKKAKVDIQNSQKERVEDIINRFTEKIDELRSKNIDTALAENKIQKAIKAKDRGDYTEAIKFALQSEGELEKDEIQREIANETLEEAEKGVEEAQKEGILVDQARRSFQEAKDSFDNGFYPKVLESAIETSGNLVKVVRLYEETNSFLENIEGVLEDFKGEKFEGSRPLEEKEDLEESFQNGEYEKAHDHLENIKTTLRENEEKIKETIYKIEDEIKEKGEKDVKKAEDKLQTAKALLDFKNPIKAMREIEQAKEISGLKKKKEYDELMKKVQKSIDNAKKFGAPVGEVKEKVDEAKKIKEKKDKIEAFEKMKEAHEQVEEALEPYSPDIEVSISDMLSLDEWNHTKVKLMNNGEALANDPSIEIRGGERKNFDLKNKLKSGEEIVVEGRIKPHKENAKIIATAFRIFDDKKFKDEEDLNISMGIEIKRANKKETCDICGDDIEKGERIIYCSCGKTYERSCGAEEGKCPNCGTNLEIEKEKQKETKKRLSLDM